MPSKAKQRRAEIDLHYAIRNRRREEVSRLLGTGVDPNCFDDKSRNFTLAFTALCTAISVAGEPISALAIELEDARKILNPNYDRGAERATSVEILRLLLAAGADANRPTLSRTPLSLAVHMGDLEVARMLLDAGAKSSGEGWSPFSKLPRPKDGLAFYGNAIHQAAEKEFTDIVRLLCSRGADTSATNHEGKTALQIAKERGHTEIVQLLEEHERASVQ